MDDFRILFESEQNGLRVQPDCKYRLSQEIRTFVIFVISRHTIKMIDIATAGVRSDHHQSVIQHR